MNTKVKEMFYGIATIVIALIIVKKYESYKMSKSTNNSYPTILPTKTVAESPVAVMPSTDI